MRLSIKFTIQLGLFAGILGFHSFAHGKEAACDFGAFVSETDPRGLNVRAAPSAEGEVLGVLPAEALSADKSIMVRIEVEVVAEQNGWFKIKNARDNTELSDLPEREVYKGEGWVSGHGLMIKSQADSGFEKPTIRSKKIVAFESGEIEFGSNHRRHRLISCEGNWAQVEWIKGKKKQKFWVNRICAIQETSCSG